MAGNVRFFHAEFLEPAPRSMDADRDGVGRAALDRRDLAVREPLPGAEEEKLTVGRRELVQTVEDLRDLVSLDCVRLAVLTRPRERQQPRSQALEPAFGPGLVHDHLPGDAV
jgi:hypothetical protein